VYCSSFALHIAKYTPGDFILRREFDDDCQTVPREELFQIITTIQAMKSWVGSWNSARNDLKCLAEVGILRRIVIDDFNVIAVCTWQLAPVVCKCVSIFKFATNRRAQTRQMKCT